jgi:hypothetical protein
MITALRYLAVLTSAALLGCQGVAGDVTGPEIRSDAGTTTSLSASSTSTAAAVATTASQSISGNVTIAAQPDPTQPGVVFDYSFSANQKIELLTPSFIQGQFHFEFQFSNVNVVVDGSVACFFVVANKARVAGVIDRTNSPIIFPVGSTMIWSVTDNDNSVLPVALPAAAPAKVPDTASPLLRLPGIDPLTFCLAGGFLPELPVIRGQVQVHSSK